MAWNPIQDIRRSCRQCNSRRFFDPHNYSHKKRVIENLELLEAFFHQTAIRKSENPCLKESAFIIRKNKEFCIRLATECKNCDRSQDKANQQIVLLK